MVTKTFKAETTIQTLQMVQAELGADAIVVSMREVPAGPVWNPWKSKAVEIIASGNPVMAAPMPVPASRPVPTQPVAKPAKQPVPQVILETPEEMPEIEWAIEPEKKAARKPVKQTVKQPPKLKLNLEPFREMALAMEEKPLDVEQTARRIPTVTEKVVPPALKQIHQQLASQGVDAVLVNGLVDVAMETLSPAVLADYETSKKYISQLLAAELRVLQGAGKYVTGNVICLVGASGSGKTSALAKLAFFFSHTLQKKVTWVCADTVRMGSIAEARAYTDAMGFKLQLVYTPQDMKEILANSEEDELFLVDTPSYNPCSELQMTELGKLLAEVSKRSTYLVAPATTREVDLIQSAAALGLYTLDGLIVTKLDETHTFGSVYNFARKNSIPLGYFTVGNEASRHLEVVDPARLVAALFGKTWSK